MFFFRNHLPGNSWVKNFKNSFVSIVLCIKANETYLAIYELPWLFTMKICSFFLYLASYSFKEPDGKVFYPGIPSQLLALDFNIFIDKMMIIKGTKIWQIGLNAQEDPKNLGELIIFYFYIKERLKKNTVHLPLSIVHNKSYITFRDQKM